MWPCYEIQKAILVLGISASPDVLNNLHVLSVVSFNGCEAANSFSSLLVSERTVTSGDRPRFKSPHLEFHSVFWCILALAGTTVQVSKHKHMHTLIFSVVYIHQDQYDQRSPLSQNKSFVFLSVYCVCHSLKHWVPYEGISPVLWCWAKTALRWNRQMVEQVLK